jgi:hypothetical protein
MTNSTLSYKELKEDFVSNLSGGSVSEILSVTAVAPVRLAHLVTRSKTKKNVFIPLLTKRSPCLGCNSTVVRPAVSAFLLQAVHATGIYR